MKTKSITVLSLVALSLLLPVFQGRAQERNGKAIVVRKLEVELPSESPTGTAYQLVFKKRMKENSVRVLRDAGQCRELFGEEWGKKVADLVDFENEKVAVVLWGLRGDDPVHWKITPERKEGRVEFAHVSHGDPTRPRMNLLSMGIELYAVLKGDAVASELRK